MTVTEAINRGNNLVAAAVSGLAGFAFFPEAIIEDHPIFKIDDTLLTILGITSIIWFLFGKNKYTRSIVPVLLVIAGLLVKIGGVIIEFKEKDDVGDDFGGLILFVLATILVVWLFVKSKKSPAN